MKKFHSISFFLLLLCIPFFQTKSTTPVSEGSKKLAKQMTRLLGVRIQPADAEIFPTWRLREWNGIPPFIFKKLKKGKYKRFVFVEFDFNKNVKEIILETPPYLIGKIDADFIIAVNNSSDEKEWIKCTFNTCNQDGSCQPWTVVTQGPCVDQCSSSGDCPKPCFMNTCENGLCKPSLFYLPECPGEFSICSDDTGCPTPGEDTTCVFSKCDHGYCIEVSYTIDSNEEECPNVECESDGDCPSFPGEDEEEGGLLDDIATIYGF